MLCRERFYATATAREAYQQGFSMVRFLVDQVGREGILQLIETLRDDGNLDRAMDQLWGVDQRGLYFAWLGALGR